MSLSSVLDQDVALRLLRQLLARQRVPNGLLFWGPDGTGKRMAALELVKALFCKAESDPPCDECLLCRKVTSGNHPDVLHVAPMEKTREIKKARVDEINEFASLRPYESSRRVVLVHDADRMNVTAQNHFLKTLEEPPGNALFILLTAYPRVLLPTIRSRCQSVRFGRLRPATVAALLQRGRTLPEDQALAIAALSQGQMSRALDLIESDKRAVALDLCARLNAGEDPVDLAETFTGLLEDNRKRIETTVKAELGLDKEEDLSRDELEAIKERRLADLNALVKRDMLEYLYLLETWYRDQLVLEATGDASKVMNRDRAADLGRSSDPSAKIAAIEKARRLLDRYVNEERVIRDLFFALATP